jgi:hypothetical protein
MRLVVLAPFLRAYRATRDAERQQHRAEAQQEWRMLRRSVHRLPPCVSDWKACRIAFPCIRRAASEINAAACDMMRSSA